MDSDPGGSKCNIPIIAGLFVMPFPLCALK